jgi:hypothetical protein
MDALSTHRMCVRHQPAGRPSAAWAALGKGAGSATDDAVDTNWTMKFSMMAIADALFA